MRLGNCGFWDASCKYDFIGCSGIKKKVNLNFYHSVKAFAIVTQKEVMYDFLGFYLPRDVFLIRKDNTPSLQSANQSTELFLHLWYQKTHIYGHPNMLCSYHTDNSSYVQYSWEHVKISSVAHCFHPSYWSILRRAHLWRHRISPGSSGHVHRFQTQNVNKERKFWVVFVCLFVFSSLQLTTALKMSECLRCNIFTTASQILHAKTRC